MQLSIVVGYRNRDFERVKRFLDSIQNQTFKDFELIFVDYGSELAIANNIEKLVKLYPFARYFYNYTIGMPWNRSHALNTGLKFANAEYIFFTDIDLVFSSDLLAYINRSISSELQLFKQVYWLPKGYSNWDELEKNIPGFSYSLEGTKGVIFVVKRDRLFEIRGFDEFYSFWGLEDNDLFQRLLKAGLKEKWLKKEEAPVYHQWHPIVSNQNKQLFPEKWWENMLIHYAVNNHVLSRNKTQWGKLYTKDDRPVFSKTEICNFELPNEIVLNTKGTLITELIFKIKGLEANQVLVIDIERKPEMPKYGVGLFYKLAKWMVSLLTKNMVIVYNEYIKDIENVASERALLIPDRDIYFVIWQLIKYNDVIRDYSIEIDKSHIRFRIC